MSNIIRPVRWWDMVSPQGEEEMIPFLRTYMGKGKQFRTPKRMWEDLWRRQRGSLNHVMGGRNFGKISNFRGPKYQQGILHPIGMWAPSGTGPDLSDIDHAYTGASGVAARVHLAYDSDGTIIWDTATTVGTVVYADLTTGTADSNDHTNEWWPDNPETNEGLNWDIGFTTVVNAYDFTFRTVATPIASRIVDTWYLLDDVSNDVVDGTLGGALVVRVIAKNTGITSTGIVDVEIREKDTGDFLAKHTVDLDATNP